MSAPESTGQSGLVSRWWHWSPVLKIFRGIGHIFSGRTHAHRRFRDRLMGIMALTIVLDFIASAIMLPAERNAPGTDINNFGDAFFYSTAQLLTISSAMKNPLTTTGRIIDCVLMLYAITVVAAVAGMFANFFHMTDSDGS